MAKFLGYGVVWNKEADAPLIEAQKEILEDGTELSYFETTDKEVVAKLKELEYQEIK